MRTRCWCRGARASWWSWCDRGRRDTVSREHVCSEELTDARPVVSSPSKPATSACTPSSGELSRDVAAPPTAPSPTESHDRQPAPPVNARDLGRPVAVEHEVAEDEHPHPGETASHTRVPRAVVKIQVFSFFFFSSSPHHTRNRASTRLHSSWTQEQVLLAIRCVEIAGRPLTSAT